MVADHILDPRITHVATTRLATRHADFDVHAYRDPVNGSEHLALLVGRLDARGGDPPLVGLHTECLAGDALGSLGCDCAARLGAAQAAVAAEGRGIVVYLRGHQGSGIGPTDELRGYAQQVEALDTYDANGAHGLPEDAGDYGAAAAILMDLGLSAVRLLSPSPAKEAALRAMGIEVTRIGQDPGVDDQGWSRLLAGGQPVVGDLGRRYGPLVAAGPRFVMAQLGQSIDGFIASRTGDARFVTGPADRVHLHRLRALVQAVVVGVDTVIADDCRLTVRSVTGPNPVRVVLDPNRRAPPEAQLLSVGDAPTLLVVADDGRVPASPAPHVEVLQLPRGDHPQGFDPHVVLAALAARGLGRVLVEGGGITVSRFLAARALDRLLVTTAPLLVGDGVPGLRFAGPDRLADALRAPVRRFLSDDDVCVEFDLTGTNQRPVGPTESDQHGEPGQHGDRREDPVAGG